ncbi:MAG: HEAT repeat domain-containing protein, partial [Gemmatimonadales bacterium]
SGSDHTQFMRATAARLLGTMHDALAEDALERLTATVEDRNLRITALNSLAATGDSARASAVSKRLIGDYDPLFAAAAVRVLARIGGDAGKAALREAMPHESRVFVRLAMQQALAPAGMH